MTNFKFSKDKIFIWIFDYYDFSLKDIVELQDFEINMDEETNSNTILNVLKKTEVKDKDIIAVKRNNKVIFWGVVEEIENENESLLYEYSLKYITNLFNRDIKLENENMIKTTGIEDFIENAIKKNFTESDDSFININYLYVRVKTHTIKQTSVSNVENNIYNLHTWMTNCTQLYNITYTWNIEKINDRYMFVLEIENKTHNIVLIDTKAQSISNYTEIFETDVVSKVEVLTSTDSLTLFLLNDKTTTIDKNNPNRAAGKILTVYTENYEDAYQTALDTMKGNSYNHNISFSLNNMYIQLGTPICIKTKNSLIYNTYISSVKITKSNFIEYQCGNIRTNFIEKLLKERKK